MTRRYFEEEMRYLQEAAKVFAEAHPEQAQYLDVDSISDRDPYVERLFEGFAFLSGRVHKRLDDEMPEYTESLLQLLYPHFLKPVPAHCIMEFTPEPGLVQETTVLERGTEVRSEPVGRNDLRCRFQTTQDVDLHPLRLENTALHYPGDNTSRVRLRFSLDRGVDAAALDLTPLRLYFQADAKTASTMHLFFTRRTSRVTVSLPGPGISRSLRGGRWVQPAALTSDEGALPYGPASFSGFRLLQEYLCLRRKFWFVDLHGIDRVDRPSDVERLEVEVVFDRPYPEERRFDSENVRLYCTPAVNLFEVDAEPIRVDGEVSEHRIVPNARYPDGIETYDVQRVVGTEEASGARHEYHPFFSFRHRKERDEGASGRFYTTSRRVGPGDRPEVYLSISDHQRRPLTDLPVETLSLELRCTNGTLPREQIREGGVHKLAPDVPEVAEPRNLTQPTLIRYPPNRDQENFFWKLISHWALNYRTIASTDALKGLLRLYDWTDTISNEQRREGLRGVSLEPKEVLDRGAVLRGAEVTVQVEEGHFADEGDLCLFGLVLSRVFSAYATMNSFVHLTLVTNPSEQRYTWTPDKGPRPIL